MAIREELKAQAHGELDELYDEEPRRRSWAAIGNVVLALALVFVGYQWNESVSREQALASQAQALRADAESLRLRAEESQRQLAEVQKRLAAVTAERGTLEERVAGLEKSAKERVTARGPERAGTGAVGKDAPKERATPASAKKRR